MTPDDHAATARSPRNPDDETLQTAFANYVDPGPGKVTGYAINLHRWITTITDDARRERWLAQFRHLVNGDPTAPTTGEPR